MRVGIHATSLNRVKNLRVIDDYAKDGGPGEV